MRTSLPMASLATAASLAMDRSIPVQEVPYAQLRQRLLADGQVLEFSGRIQPKRTAAPQ